MSTATLPVPVIFNHSAAIDDFVATALLLSMPNVELKGIVVTNADCVADPAMEVSWMVHQFFGLEHIPLTLSNARGWNAFPWEYRSDCIRMAGIDILKPFSKNVQWPPYPSGEDMLVDLLRAAIRDQRPVKILATGPITAVTNVVKADKSLLAGIGEIIWMGGAIDVPGNLDPKSIPLQIANTHAEWNAFWDPTAVADMFELFSKVRIFPLDITDKARITPGFIASLKAQQQYPYSDFVYQAYALVTDEPFYEMWNTCATTYLAGRDDIFAPPELAVLSMEQYGFEQGWIQRSAGKGSQQEIYLDLASPQNFYDYILQQLKK